MVLGDSIDLAKSTAEAALADLRKLIIAGMCETRSRVSRVTAVVTECICADMMLPTSCMHAGDVPVAVRRQIEMYLQSACDSYSARRHANIVAHAHSGASAGSCWGTRSDVCRSLIGHNGGSDGHIIRGPV